MYEALGKHYKAHSAEARKERKTAKGSAFVVSTFDTSAFGGRRLRRGEARFTFVGWNWVCPAMVREWLREKDQPPRGYRPHPERWRVSDWEQILGRCAGEEGDLLIDSESVHLSEEEESTFGALFKNRKSSKNGYKIRDYVDRKPRNVAVAILQILQPHMTTYMSFSGREDTSSLAVADKFGKACGGCRGAFGVGAVQGGAFGRGAFGVETPREHSYGRRQGCEDMCAFGGSAFGETRLGRWTTDFLETKEDTPSEEEEVATNPELMVMDQKYRQLEERYNFLQDQCALAQKLQKAALKLRDEMVTNARREIDELRAKVQTDSSVDQIQIRNLADELVRKTQALEQSEAVRRADKELLCRLQSQCDELRT
ncbi:hypothetical protein AXG93_509s1550 [Marchantia polymorpha subsp. ruderalis]|uniref:Uncharacterized protein n=1 Tax=Marchantia polymorpha subsp. ruderalis TaxID=1480154 RepID=A0A176WBE0_MARPO|nr:hypothetical protein AXG93_509s1550 [Marchantia polymorpha subsp. ruderalis]